MQKTTLNEIRKDKTANMRKTATEVLTEVEIAKLKGRRGTRRRKQRIQ